MRICIYHSIHFFPWWLGALIIPCSYSVLVYSSFLYISPAGPFLVLFSSSFHTFFAVSRNQSQRIRMHIATLFISLVLSTAVAAHGKGNKTEKALSTEDTCKEMRGLQGLITLASNTTELDSITKDNATKIADIQAKASSAATKLQTLQ